MSYDAWGQAWGTPSAWGVAWVHSGIVPPPPPPSGPIVPPTARGGGAGGITQWTTQFPRNPEERKPIFKRNMENRDRADIEDIMAWLASEGDLQ